MESLLKKSLASLGLTVCVVGAISSVSYASIALDSDATRTGSGARAIIYAYTSQSNESYNYKITVQASTNDGTSQYNQKDPASSTDTVSLSFTTLGAVSSGTSIHEWVMVGESGSVNKSIDFH